MTNKRTHRLRWSTLVAVVAVLPLALAGCVGEDKSCLLYTSRCV